eukprot:scaffold29_cov364-Pavlova_lutheri.AAC.5
MSGGGALACIGLSNSMSKAYINKVGDQNIQFSSLSMRCAMCKCPMGGHSAHEVGRFCSMGRERTNQTRRWMSTQDASPRMRLEYGCFKSSRSSSKVQKSGAWKRWRMCGEQHST